MTPLRELPDLPFKLTDHVNKLIDRMGTLDPWSAPPVEPAILAPFWAVGDFINFSGPPGCGKSMLAADILMGAALPQREGAVLGGLFQFDVDELRGGPVAIIDGENNKVRWNSILRRKLEAEGVDSETPLRSIKYIHPSDFELQNSNNWKTASVKLAQALAMIRVRFFVVDTIARIWAPDDINSTAWVQQGLVPFRAACQEYGITALLLSHTKRHQRSDDPTPTGPIGTSFQEGQIDGQIILNRMKNGAGLSFVHQKSRRSFWIQQGSKINLQFRPGLGYEPMEGWQEAWPHECPDGDGFKGIEPDMRSRIASLLSGDSPREWKSKELAAEVCRDDRTVRHHLEALERSHQAFKIGSGPSTRWRAAP